MRGGSPGDEVLCSLQCATRLLQIATGITESAMDLLEQIATGATNCDDYCKLQQRLKSIVFIPDISQRNKLLLFLALFTIPSLIDNGV